MTCKNNFKDLCRKEFDGGDCCILGAGPSLSLADLSATTSMPCFAVNSAILGVEWSLPSKHGRFWVSNDALCLRWTYWDKVVKSACDVIVRDSWCKYRDLLPARTKFFKPRSSNINLDGTEEGLCYCSSIPTCIDIAIQFKFKNIYIYGLDHDGSNTGYFWDQWNENKKPRQVIDFNGERSFYTKPVALRQPQEQRLAVWRENIDCFKALNDHAQKNGVNIINMNKNSSVNIFDKNI